MYKLILQAKREIFSVKEQRLQLAKDEYEHLNDTLSGWKSSRTSCKCQRKLHLPNYPIFGKIKKTPWSLLSFFSSELQLQRW